MTLSVLPHDKNSSTRPSGELLPAKQHSPEEEAGEEEGKWEGEEKRGKRREGRSGGGRQKKGGNEGGGGRVQETILESSPDTELCMNWVEMRKQRVINYPSDLVFSQEILSHLKGAVFPNCLHPWKWGFLSRLRSATEKERKLHVCTDELNEITILLEGANPHKISKWHQNACRSFGKFLFIYSWLHGIVVSQYIIGYNIKGMVPWSNRGTKIWVK